VRHIRPWFFFDRGDAGRIERELQSGLGKTGQTRQRKHKQPEAWGRQFPSHSTMTFREQRLCAIGSAQVLLSLAV